MYCTVVSSITDRFKNKTFIVSNSNIKKDINLMIRENIDGKPIYSDQLWYKLLDVGEILRKLGYEERPNKPNLFSKPFGTGYLYADMRGDYEIPLWEDSGLTVYYYANLPYALFLQEMMILVRNGLEISSYKKYPLREDAFIEELDTYHKFFLDDYIRHLNGYCSSCGKDFFSSIEWFKLEAPEVVPKYELLYCEKCRQEKYKIRKERLERRKFEHDLRHTCCLCGTIIETPHDHHITYSPEETIRVCIPCHLGLIHCCTFPNYLWKQKKPKKKTERMYWCHECGKRHFTDSEIGIEHAEDNEKANLKNELNLLVEREVLYAGRIFTHPKQKEWLEEQLGYIEKKKKKLNERLRSLR